METFRIKLYHLDRFLPLTTKNEYEIYNEKDEYCGKFTLEIASDNKHYAIVELEKKLRTDLYVLYKIVHNLTHNVNSFKGLEFSDIKGESDQENKRLKDLIV